MKAANSNAKTDPETGGADLSIEPRLATAFKGIWLITWRGQSTVRRLPFLIPFLCGIPLLAWFTVNQGRSTPFFHWAVDFYLLLMVPLYCLSVAGALIRDELQADTLGFLATRPLTRARLFLLKFLSQLIIIELLGFASALLVLTVGVARGIPGILAFAPVFFAAQFLAILAYAALSSFLGLLTQRYMVLGIVYGFIVEFGIGRIPTNINNLSMSRHLRAVLGGNSTIHDLYRWSPEGTWFSIFVMIGAALAFVIAGAVLFTFKEYHHNEEMQR